MYWILKQKDSQIVNTYTLPKYETCYFIYMFLKGLSHEMDLAFDEMYG